MFFSAREVIGPFFGQVHLRPDEALKGAGGKGCRHIDDCVFDLASVAVVLPFDANSVASAFGSSRFVNHADCVGIGMLSRDELAASPEHSIMIPLDGLEESLQSSRGDSLLQRDRFDVLASDLREQSANVDRKEPLAFDATKTVSKECQKLTKHLSKRCDILEPHGATFRGFAVKQIAHGGSSLFHPQVNGDKVVQLKDLAHY